MVSHAILAAWAAMASGVSAMQTTSSTMGPAAFMWPPDRVWAADFDNTAPCGSIATVQNRTNFPMTKGQIALVAQDESYDLELAISYLEDPQTENDFHQLIDMETFREIELGHTCVTLPDAPSTIKEGANATLQIKYIADFDKPENQTFYACSDITFVPLTSFKERVPCFNATLPSNDEPDDKNKGDGKGDKTNKSGSGSSGGQTDKSGSSGAEAGKKSSGLSGGAVAGIVIGALSGVSLLLAGAIIVYRRKQQRLRILRQQNSERSKWATDTQSQASVRLNNL